MKKPDFFIVGAPRCGTTAMYKYLKQHPEIFMPSAKEIHFFGTDFQHVGRRMLTREKYLSYFTKAKDERRIGEGSTSYFYSKRAAMEIKEFNPSASIIIMLRNPVDMMYSLHNLYLFTGAETFSDFEAALSAEKKRKEGFRLPDRPILVEGLFYREVAMFTKHLQRYLDVFGHDNVHIIIFDDFKRDTAGVYRETLRFLAVSLDFQPDFQIVNSNKRPRSKSLYNFLLSPPQFAQSVIRAVMPSSMRDALSRGLRWLNTAEVPRPAMSRELRKHLQAEFLPEVEQLSDLLGRDLTHWCKEK